MKLEHILDTIKYGELATTSWEDKDPQIINFINLGLIQLYSRFPISEKQVLIQQYPQISLYRLSREFARTNVTSPMPHKYILDTPFEPFMNDVMFITDICSERGAPIPLNDTNDPRSYFLTSFDTLQIPNANEHETTFILYRAKPLYISPRVEDKSIDIYIPECLLEALTTYVGFKAMQSIGGEEGITQSQTLLQRFDQLCNEVITNNLLGNNVNPTNLKLRMRGFV